VAAAVGRTTEVEGIAVRGIGWSGVEQAPIGSRTPAYLLAPSGLRFFLMGFFSFNFNFLIIF
jgi:hypothetical protein